MDENISLKELALNYDKIKSEKSFEEQYYNNKRDPSTGALAIFVLIFIFFALIFWAGLSIGQPSWCLTPSSGLDNGKAFGAALIIAFFVLIIVAIIWSLAGGIGGKNNSWGLAIALIIIIVVILLFAIFWGIYRYNCQDNK